MVLDNSTAVLTRTQVSKSGAGLAASNSLVSMDASELFDNRIGASVIGGDVTIRRSRIHDNSQLGLLINGTSTNPAEFNICYNMVYRNGTAGPEATGNVRIDATYAQGLQQAFKNNTLYTDADVQNLSCSTNVNPPSSIGVMANVLHGGISNASNKCHLFYNVEWLTPTLLPDSASYDTLLELETWRLAPNSPARRQGGPFCLAFGADADGDVMTDAGDIGADQQP